jgi:type I restriction enzyme, S subunit
MRAEHRRLADIAQVASGVTLGRTVPEGASIQLPYLRVANVQDGYIDTDDVKTVRVLPSEVERFELKRGDVLLTEGGDFDKLGRGAVWDERISPCLHQNHVFRVRCLPSEMIPEFLTLYMASPKGRRFFLGIAKQTTNLATISSSQLKEMPVPCPPLAEQRRIVEVLEAVTEAKRSTEASIAKLRALRVGVLEGLATCDQIQLGEVLSSGPQNGLYKPGSAYGPEGTPIVRINSFNGGPSDLTRGLLRIKSAGREIDQYGLKLGDILINRVNTPELVGKSTSVAKLEESTVFESNLMRCTLDPDRAVPTFVEAWLSTAIVKAYFLRRAKSAVSQASINQSDVLACPFPDLDVSEQRVILQRLHVVASRQSDETAKLVKLRKIKEGLADDLLTGRVRLGGIG